MPLVFMLMTSHFLFFLTMVSRGLCFELGRGASCTIRSGVYGHPSAYQIKLPANSEHPAWFLYIRLYLSVAVAIEHRSQIYLWRKKKGKWEQNKKGEGEQVG